jgi:glycosyltransferase involved in cell wall biosynthesis
MIDSNKTHVIHVVADLHTKSGGPSRSIVNLIDSLSKENQFSITLFSQKLIGEQTIKPKSNKVNITEYKTKRKLFKNLSIVSFCKFYLLIKKKQTAVIHIHGLWSLHNHWTIVLARRFEIPYIIHTRGMLMPNALKFKTFKKNIAMSIFQQKDITCADMLIATSTNELQTLRDLGISIPIAVIPNGIELKNNENTYESRISIKKGNERTILFLSRIHPIKGLENLLKAWAISIHDGWKLKIAGPDNGGYLKDIFSLINDLNISDSVEYLGEVFHESKERVFNDADLFILPTLSENFGLVVLEALSYGIPVITTHEAPWSDLEKYNCGWWVDTSVNSISKVIKKAILIGDSNRNIMSLNAIEYVKIYDWSLIATDTARAYSWIINDGKRPDFVHLKL